MTEKEKNNTDLQSPLFFASQLAKVILSDIESSSKTSLNAKYNKDKIIGYLQAPEKAMKELRSLSQYLYNVSPNYKRLVQYFAGLLRFDYIVEPYDLDIEKVNIDQFKKQYNKTLKSLEIMNIPHEFTKVLKYGFKEDVFYGYEFSTDDSYYIKRLDPDFCKISSIEDGVYNFSFDFSFFKKDSEVEAYPQEFKSKYKQYKNDRKKQWQELESKNTICFKVNEELVYPMPPFSSVFEAIFDIDDNKRMRKVKTKMDNYMILTQKIPIASNQTEPNKFLIDMDTAMNFHKMASGSLPDEVGLITSPMDIEAIKLERGKNNDNDNVAESERNYYNAAGVSQALFNTDKSSVASMGKSIITDEQIVFMALQQLERWLNRKLKQSNGKYKFRVKFLETTRFNVDTVRDGLLKSAQYGMPVKSALAATWGYTPSAFMNMTFLENEIMNLPEKLIPLSSSHTTSGKDGAGAPAKNEDELTDSGVQTRDNDGNIRE
ncbi:hypothetical protein [Bacillus sp. UMB0728]|uniref:hypothetical protein n=1 Tax=Bacillus sp. UMB0728 TaxID=2066052 RepID=UPI000C784ECD|nr:hypothetical protein [Bacillus sp. UMB0728]PLR72307.1 hypothetical protein CYJ37_12180 [Bacillus sp. UMB0728]